MPYHTIDLDKGAYFVELYDDTDTLIFQGIIPKISVNNKGPKFTAYDPSFYISRISEIFQFDKLPAGECVKKMLKEFDMPIGTIENCDVKIDEYYYKETIADIIKKIIETIKEDKGENWHFYFKDNAFHFVKRNSDKYLDGQIQPKEYQIYVGNGYVNIFNFIKDASYTSSFENMKNSIIVVDGDDEKMNKVDTAKDNENIKKYGLLQYVVKQEKNNQDKSAKKGRSKDKNNKKDGKGKKEDKNNKGKKTKNSKRNKNTAKKGKK
nr:MAG TPA: 43 kDa tail protein [Caudoviricetes sp.]